MGQITQNFVDLAMATCKEGRHPSLTVWEAQQLLHAWNERDEANRVCEQWRQWTVATREENDKLRAEVASWKRLADIQEQSLKESCAEVEWLQATLAKALTWVPRSGIPGRFKAEVEKQLASTVSGSPK